MMTNRFSLFKRIITVLFSSFISISVMAGTPGIEATNYSISTSLSDSDTGNRLLLSGSVRFPIANYTGATLSGRNSNFDGQDGFLDSTTNAASLGIFLRNSNLGMVEARYDYSKTEADSGNFTNSTDTFSLSGTYYLQRADLEIERSKSTPETGPSFNASFVRASYYFTDNLRTGVVFSGMDTDDSKGIGLTYQPQVFNNTVGLSASYQDSDRNDSFTLSASYFFNTKVTLFDRARKY